METQNAVQAAAVKRSAVARQAARQALYYIKLLLYIGTGLCIAYGYQHYISHSPQALEPHSDDDIQWLRVKLIMVVAWLLALLRCLWLAKRNLRAKERPMSPDMTLRFIGAGLMFLISVTSLYPLNVELSAYFFLNSLAYVLILPALFRLPGIGALCCWLGKLALLLLRLPGWYWALAAAASVLYMADRMSGRLFEHFPWIDDTIVQLVHAKFILKGHWYGISHPLRQFFTMKMMINDGRWYSQYPPGHVLLLALGLLFHHVYLVNPALGALTCVAVWLLAKEIYGPHVARIAALLSALCVYIVILSSEYMNNATSLLTVTLFLWAYFRVLNRQRPKDGLIAGAMLGYCLITRPYSAFGIALVPAVYAAYLIVSRPRRFLLPMVCIAGVVGCFIAFQLYYNTITTGKPLVFGYQKNWGDNFDPFNPNDVKEVESWQVEKFMFQHLCMNIERLNYFNRMLFEWPVPALAPVLLLFGLRGNRRDERLLFLIIAFMFLSVQVVSNRDFGWGPRLVYELNGILLVLCAKALSLVPAVLRTVSERRHSLACYYGAGIITLAVFYAYAWNYNFRIPVIRDLYVLNKREGDPEFYRYIVRRVTTPSLVFVPSDYYHFVSFTNPPFPSNPIIFAIDRKDEDQQLMRYYPNRDVYSVSVSTTSSRPSVKKIRP